MMEEYLTYTYAIFPTPEKEALLNCKFNFLTQVFNQLAAFVNNRFQSQLDQSALCAELMRYPITLPSANDAFAVKSVKKCIAKQFIPKLYSGKIKEIWPRREYRPHRTFSYSTVQFQNATVILPDIGAIEVTLHRPLPASAQILSVTVSSDCYGADYHISVCLSYVSEPTALQPIRYDHIIGLDYAQDGLYVDSQGRSGDYPGFRRLAKKELDRHRQAARKFHPGSARWKKHRQRALKLERHIVYQRRDWQNKRVAQLAAQYDAVCTETLNFQNMIKENPSLSGKIYDNAFAAFQAKLDRKLQQSGKLSLHVSGFYASSQICSVCGKRVVPMPISSRVFQCPHCHTVMQRDINAAKNIQSEGMKKLCG